MHQMRISTTQVSTVMLRSKELEIRKKVKTVRGVGWNQTECHEIEPSPSKNRAMPEGDKPSFWVELQNLLFFWQFNSFAYSKASTDVLSNLAVEALGD